MKPPTPAIRSIPSTPSSSASAFSTPSNGCRPARSTRFGEDLSDNRSSCRMALRRPAPPWPIDILRPSRPSPRCWATWSASRSALGTLSRGREAFRKPREGFAALAKLAPMVRDWRRSVTEVFDRAFGDNEAVKCALAANLPYWHDDPDTLWWILFAVAQGGYLASGGRYIRGGSARLSEALADATRRAGGEIVLGRQVTDISLDADGQSVRGRAWRPQRRRTGGSARADRRRQCGSFGARGHVAGLGAPALLVGLCRPSPVDLGLLGDVRIVGASGDAWLPQLFDIPAAAVDENIVRPPPQRRPSRRAPGREPPLMTRRRLFRHRLRAGRPALSGLGGRRRSAGELVGARQGRPRRSSATNGERPSSRRSIANFRALPPRSSLRCSTPRCSMHSYLNAPEGAIYGFAPLPPSAPIWRGTGRSAKTPIRGLYLASSYAGSGGYTGAILAGSNAAKLIL